MSALVAARLCLAVASIVCFLLVVYPYLLYPAALRALPRRPLARTASVPRSASLLFCAYNEGKVMRDKLSNIEVLKARHPDLEVLAFDDGSTDDTREILASRPDLVTLVEGAGRSGKAHGMKQLAAKAHGDVLVFTDANVLLDAEALRRLTSYYADVSVGGVCGALRYVNSSASSTASVGGAYWRLEERIKSLESRSGNVMGADGSIFSVRRELYPEFPDTVLDDLTVSMAVVFAKKRLIKVDDVVAYEQLAASRGDEFARKVRISARAFHTHLYLRPQLKRMTRIDRFKYSSRKFVRWFGGLFLAAGTLCSVLLVTTFSLWAGVALLTAVGLGAAALTSVRSGPFAFLAETIIALMATFLGVVKAARGQTVVTWSPAKSR